MKKNILIILALFGSVNSYAQFGGFSQNFSNPLFLNPAFAGSLGCSRMALDYRNQPAPGSLVTYSASYDQFVDKIAGGIGLQLISVNFDKGNFTANTINGMYAYNFKINDNVHIRPAFNIGMGVNHAEESVFYNTTPSKYFFNAGFGLLFTYKNFISGFSFDHINNPDIGFDSKYKLPSKFALHFSYEFPLSAIMQLSPGIIYFHEKDYIENEMDYNLMLKIKFIKAGIGFRQVSDNPDDGILMLGYCCDWMSLGYSYDMAISKLSNSAKGVSEISAVFKFNCKNDKEKFKISQLANF